MLCFEVGGRMSERALVLLAAATFAVGCGHESAAIQEVRTAAAVDLECESSMIEFVDDQPMRKRVTGCGRTLTYMYRCVAEAGGGQTCRWKAVRDPSNQL